MVNVFWFVPLENSRDKRKFCKGSPVFPVETFRVEMVYIYTGGVRHYSQSFMGKTVYVPHFNGQYFLTSVERPLDTL